jgi:hypothetical protein
MHLQYMDDYFTHAGSLRVAHCLQVLLKRFPGVVDNELNNIISDLLVIDHRDRHTAADMRKRVSKVLKGCMLQL